MTPGRANLRACARRGEDDARTFLERPESLSHLPLGDFGAGGPLDAAVRRSLHALRVPCGFAAAACRLLGDEHADRAAAFAERYAYWHGAHRVLDGEAWRRLTRGTAILMYHAFGPAGEAGSQFVVPADRFARQLGWLGRRRHPVISLGELVACRTQGRLPPAGAVVITLDDGYADNLELAAPLLKRAGFPAIVFAVSGRLGQTASWDGAADLAGRQLLDAAGLSALDRLGLTVGAHTRTHPRLPELGRDEASAEIAGSRADLERLLGSPIRAFAYPYGRSSRAVAEATGGAGFQVACGIERGLNHPATPLLDLRRAPVDGNASTLRFACAVRYGDPAIATRILHRLLTAIRWRFAQSRPAAEQTR